MLIVARRVSFDERLQGFSIFLLEFFFDILQIDFASGDNKSDEVSVVSSDTSHCLLQASCKEL